MYKVAVITMGIRLDDEKGYTRFRSVCEFLADAGYQVDLITTTFQHWEKAQRDLEKIKNEKYKFGVKFIYEPGYKKNIDLRRIYSHRIAAKNLMNLLEKEGDYDLLYAEIPPNDVALAAAEYAKKKGIPFVADVNDLWPEAMRMIIDIPVISDIIFYSLLRDAEKVYRLASGVIGTSDEYRDRPFKRRNRDIPRETVYVGNELTVFDAGAAQRTAEIVKDKEEFWVSYAGTIGTSYDIRTMVLAGEELAKRGMPQIKIKILGGGPMKEELEELANSRKISNVEFVGYAPYDLMAAYLKKSDILVNSFVKKAPQSIVTKIGDYLAAGKPMINTCMSPEFRAKVKNDGFGVNIIPENQNLLTGLADLTDAAIGKRPVAVMVNNIPAAMPQYGVEKADIIFEIPVEGDQTRFMALYADYTTVPQICAIRSCRYYFPALSQGFDAFYVNWGIDDSIADYLEALNLDQYDGIYNAGGLFGRDMERRNQGYALEHTGYFDGTKFAEVVQNTGKRTDLADDKKGTAFQFNGLNEQVKPSEDVCKKVSIDFGAQSATLVYDEASNTYKKEIDGNAQIDGKTGNQLAFTNVFVLETTISVKDDLGHKAVDWDGWEDSMGYYISNGAKQKIHWSKEENNELSRLTFYDESGNEISINRGKSYIAFNYPNQTTYE